MSEKVFFNCTNGGPIKVYVKDGKVIRIRPIVLGKEDAASWTLDINGRKFTPPRKTTLTPAAMTHRLQVYSKDRLKYPLKRVDFDPQGKRSTETRGKSAYERISWDEALDIVAGEMKRIRAKYGPAAVLAHAGSHHNFGNIGYHQSAFWRFIRLIGVTEAFENTDSWEGWHWGAIDTWGFYWRLGLPEQSDLLEDVLKNTDLIVNWSHDPDSTHGGWSGQENAIHRLWLKEMGKKMIFIDPFCNYTSVIFGDKWIAPRPGTDTAMAEAIAYVWITGGTYDKDYVANRTAGFEEFKKHIIGEDDGIPKTPGWAEEITGVPARTITALAREWASKRTTLSCGNRAGEGGACRAAYGHEWARLMVLLQAMQGLGKPGVNIWGTMGVPFNYSFNFPGYAEQGLQHLAKKPVVNPVKQRLQRCVIADAILNPPVHWLGEGFCFQSLEQRFIPYTYPEPGSPEIRMYYKYGGSFIGCFPDGNKLIRAYQSPKLEFVVNQDCWWSTETGFADIILPACTTLERNDIGEWGSCGGYVNDSSSSNNHRVVIYQHKCIEPLGESRSDYQIFSDLAERLGVKEEYTEGNTMEDWIKKEFESSDLPKYISFDEFKKKGYFVVPLPEEYKSTPALRWFYEGRECDTPDRIKMSSKLTTYSGKIEFVSQSILKYFPDDEEKPPVPRYIPSWEGHASELASKYPLQLLTPHSRYTYHTHYDSHVEPWLGDIPGHRILKNGYYWQTVRIHPFDAEARGINDRDIIKVYNDRGAVLGIACVTERMRPGVVHSYESSSKYDPVEPGKAGSVDRGGCMNILAPSRMMSRNAPGMACNSCLVEITKWE